MAASLPQIVRDRAAGRCEYCRLPQAATSVPFEIDHIISRKHHGPTIASNLANACWYCNTFKGSDISGLDPRTRKLTRLFHPRRHKWTHHFRYDGPVLLGRTAIGRTTIRVLQINCDDALQRFTLELRTLLSFSLDFLASSVDLVCDPRVNRCNVARIANRRRTILSRLGRKLATSSVLLHPYIDHDRH